MLSDIHPFHPLHFQMTAARLEVHVEFRFMSQTSQQIVRQCRCSKHLLLTSMTTALHRRSQRGTIAPPIKSLWTIYPPYISLPISILASWTSQQWCSRGKRRSPKYFLGNCSPDDISTRGNSDTVTFPKVSLKKCKVYGKLILEKII